MHTTPPDVPARHHTGRRRVLLLVALAAVALALLALVPSAEASSKPDIKASVGEFPGHGFGVKLANVGTAGTGAFTVEIHAAQLHVVSIPNIPSGHVTFVLLDQAPCHQFVTVIADIARVTGDTNLANNTASGTRLCDFS